MDPFPGNLKGYELRERIGAGSFGVVYRAYQPSIGRDVAIKVISPRFANEPDFVRRFETEAQVIARLEHPHIVPLYDYWRNPNGAYLVMRWLRSNLRRAMAGTPWGLEAAARLLDQIASALAVAHREGIVHRDIKPDNILLDEDQNAYLADFGIAKDIHLRVAGSMQDAGIEQTAYLSPEEIRGETATSRSDLYSLGHVIYELLTGCKPFPEAKTPADYMKQHLSAPLPALSLKQPQIPAAVDEVLQTATAKEPTHRYPSALRFAAAFRAALPERMARIPSQPLADPLTERELEVLRLVVTGRTNVQIAEELYLTPGTVKWYLKQIYSKLDVHSRQQAVDRAISLRLTKRTAMIDLEDAPQASVAAEPPQISAVELENPYKGLRAFQETDADDFFGRANLTERLLSRLSEPGDGGRFLVLVGPSGSGKSSAIRAGLIPALRSGALAESPRPFIADMMPGRHPLEELEAALLRVAVSPMPELLAGLLEDRRGLARAAKRLLPNDHKTELILFVDQFEEVFTLVEDESVRAHFIDNLLSAASDPRGRVRVILTLRADFYDRPLLYPRLAEIVRAHTEVIVPLNAREMEQAMIAPAERAGVRWETGLVATIIQDLVEQPGALPLLQYALTELFERRDGTTLTLDAYRAMGGALGALSRRADDIYGNLDGEGQKLARQLFLRLVTLGEGTEDTRRRVPLAEVITLADEGQMDDVIGSFVEYRLLTLDRDPLTHAPTVEIAHEALIREWGRLREWLAESREDVRMQRSLAHSAAEWASGDASFLASGTRLAQYEMWAADTDLALTPVERSFLEASVAARERQEHLEEERQAHQQKLERRSRNVLRALVGVLFVATVVASGLMVFAMSQSQVAQANEISARESADYARSMALSSGAKAALLSNNPDQAIALAVASLDVDDPPGFAESTLYEVAFAPATRRVFDDRPSFLTGVSPSGEKALSWSDAEFALWDIETGDILSEWSAAFLDGMVLDNLIFAPDEETAYAAIFNTDFSDGAVIEFDVSTGELVREFALPSDIRHGPPYPLALTSDGQMLLAGTFAVPQDNGDNIPGRLFAWDAITGNLLREFPETVFDQPYDPSSLALSADSGEVIMADYNGRVVVWDIHTGEPLREFASVSGEEALVFHTSAGIALATKDNAAFTTTASLLDAATGEVLHQQTWSSPANSVAVSNNGDFMALGFVAPHIVILDVDTWQTTHELYGHNFAIVDVDFALGDHTLLSTSFDQTTRAWNLSNGAERFHISGFDRFLSGFIITPDGRFAVAQEYGQDTEAPLTLWDLQAGEAVRSLGTAQQHFRALALSPDGSALLSAATPESQQCPGPGSDITLTDITTGQILWQVRKEIGSINSGVVFTRDGSRILTVDWQCEDFITVWDAATGEVLERWEGHEAPNWGIAASPEGKWIATASRDATAILWDAATGQAIYTLAHDQPVISVVFSPDSRLVLTAEEGGVLHLWETETAREVQQLVGHTASTLFVAFSPDGRYVLSSGQESNIFIWDLETGEAIRQYRFPLISPLGSVATFAPDGQSIFLTDETNSVRQLDLMLEPGQLLEWVRENRYIPELTCEQRELYRVEPLCSDGEV